VGRSLFLKSPQSAGLGAFLDVAPSLVSAESLSGLMVMGGAVGRVSVSATAFAHRGAGVYAFVQADYADAAHDFRHGARVERFWRALRPHSAGQYVNMMHAEDAQLIGEAYPPPTHARLAAIKRRYDPTNIFRFNQNIVPA
jgi:FAD/FMN-containing dehydrogenase